MHILISNDDGYLAPGIKVLAEAASEFAEVILVAPDRNRSAASNSLTLRRPLYVHKYADNHFYIEDGTPSDCVHMALTGILEIKPDMVISGINHGANMGDDVIYSGTVAAAMEGRHLGYPAIAFSMDAFEPKYWETASKAVKAVLSKIMVQELPKDSILNVNIPDIPWTEVVGFSATRLGQRHPSEDAIKQIDPRGNEMFWVGPVGKVEDCAEGSDFYAIEQGHISVTPLTVDLTRHSQLNKLQQWVPEAH
jgi:5'-nucleotidase